LERGRYLVQVTVVFSGQKCVLRTGKGILMVARERGVQDRDRGIGSSGSLLRCGKHA
jgi:hypothetical protein